MTKKKNKRATVKLNTKRNGDLYFEGGRGRVTIRFNQEAEYKLGLFFRREFDPDLPPPDTASLDEQRIAEVGWEIWNAYREDRYRQEEKEGLAPLPVTLADGTELFSIRSEAQKERRLREFFMMASGHPCDLEIRQEIKDGAKITMIKIGNGAYDGAPVINRGEIIIASHVDESIGTLLSGLLAADLSDETRDLITRAFKAFKKDNSPYIPSARTETMRDKSKNIRTLYADEDGDEYVVVFEPAFDRGSGITMADQRWPIREYEGEVKAIYEKESNINIKDHPEAAGLDADDIRKISEAVLLRERQNLMAFAEHYLKEKTQEDPERYGDIAVKPIYKSKSWPGLAKLARVLERGGAAVEKAIKHNRKNGFTIHPGLAAKYAPDCAA